MSTAALWTAAGHCRFDRWTTRGFDPEALKAVLNELYGLSLSEER